MKKSKWCSLLLLLPSPFFMAVISCHPLPPSPLQFFKWDHFQTCSLKFTLIGSSCKFLIFEIFSLFCCWKACRKFSSLYNCWEFWFKILNFRRKTNLSHFDHGVLSQGFLQFLAFHHSFVYKKILCFTKSVLWDFMFLSSFNNLKGIVSFFVCLFVSFLFLNRWITV